jgi:hypothetical protein
VKIKGKGGTDFADFTMAGEAGRETTLMCPVAHMEGTKKRSLAEAFFNLER